MNDPQSLRVPPHSIEAEQSVLGGLMLDNKAWDKVGDKISGRDFYRADHQHIFNAISELAGNDKPFDVVTLSERLDSLGDLEGVGGLVYLAKLANETPSSANIDAYADIVFEYSILRQLIRVGTDIANDSYQPQGRRSQELLDNAEKKVFEIADRSVRSKQGFESVSELSPKVYHRISELVKNKAKITGLATGFSDFDNRTSGLQNGDLIIVAGRPSMGKTTFSMNVAENVAQMKKTVAIFSMEMSSEALVMRMMASLSRVDMQKLRTGDISDDSSEWDRLTLTAATLNEIPIYIDDSASLSPTEIQARARRIKRDHSLGLIVVDYLQLMRAPGYGDNRVAEISEISRSLKALARELDIPIIALSQLNRSLEHRTNKRPMMADLRESGAIEQDADLIVFIYRHEVYEPDDEKSRGTAEIIIGKQRNGPIGKDTLTFNSQCVRFDSYFEPEQYGGPITPPDYNDDGALP